MTEGTSEQSPYSMRDGHGPDGIHEALATSPRGAAAPEAEQARKHGLTGRLGTLDVIVAVVAASGPIAAVAGYVPLIVAFGNGSAAPLSILVAGAVLVIFTAGYTAMTRYMKNPGALYAYVTAGLGRPAGLATSFLAVLTYGSFLVGVYAFFGLEADGLVNGTFGGPHITWWIYALICWAIVTGLSYFQIEVSAKVLGWALLAEVTVLVVWNVITLFKGGAHGLVSSPFSWNEFSSGSVGLGILFAMGQFAGFETTAVYREELKDSPTRVIPRATYFSVGIMAVLYSISAYVLVIGLGVQHAPAAALANPAGVFNDSVGVYAGHFLQDITSILIVTSTLAAQLSAQNVLSRYLFSLGVDGVLPRKIGQAHAKHGSPHRAALTVSAVVLVFEAILIATGRTGETIYSEYAGMLFYGFLVVLTITAAAIFVFFLRNRGLQASWWSRAVSPVIACACFGTVAFLATKNFKVISGGSTALAVTFVAITWAVVALGVGLAYVLRITHPDTYRRIGRNA